MKTESSGSDALNTCSNQLFVQDMIIYLQVKIANITIHFVVTVMMKRYIVSQQYFIVSKILSLPSSSF